MKTNENQSKTRPREGLGCTGSTLRDVTGVSRGISGASGLSQDASEASWRALGASQDLSWLPQGCLEASPSTSEECTCLVPSLPSPPGTPRDLLGGIPHGPPKAPPGCSGNVLGVSWGVPGGSLGSPWGPPGAPGTLDRQRWGPATGRNRGRGSLGG